MSAPKSTPLIVHGIRSLRAAGPEDLDRLRDWRNQEHIRRASFSQDIIQPDAHANWFARMLTRKDGVWAIYELSGTPIGHVNAIQTEANGHCWRWSFYIGATDAPPGEGSAMLTLMLRYLFEMRAAQTIEAIALSENLASLAIHRKLGFRETGSVDPAESKGLDARFFLLDNAQWTQHRGAVFEALVQQLEEWEQRE